MRTAGYQDFGEIARRVAEGRHREVVGGLWEKIGRLTLDYLVAQGLTPRMNVLDVGCGCLRIGKHLVDYLEPNRYWGVDHSQELLDAGYERELGRRGRRKLPRSHLLRDGEFDFSRLAGRPSVDVALAQSVFTHLPLDNLRLCLARLGQCVAPGARFFATFFHCRKEQAWDRPIYHETGGVTTYSARDPFHYRTSDIRQCIGGLPWSMSEPVDWSHPRDQAMVVFHWTG